jgi:hypothetical protein
VAQCLTLARLPWPYAVEAMAIRLPMSSIRHCRPDGRTLMQRLLFLLTSAHRAVSRGATRLSPSVDAFWFGGEEVRDSAMSMSAAAARKQCSGVDVVLNTCSVDDFRLGMSYSSPPMLHCLLRCSSHTGRRRSYKS